MEEKPVKERITILNHTYFDGRCYHCKQDDALELIHGAIEYRRQQFLFSAEYHPQCELGQRVRVNRNVNIPVNINGDLDPSTINRILANDVMFGLRHVVKEQGTYQSVS